jgi:hypothetical protein
MAKFKNLDLILNKDEKAKFNGSGANVPYFTYTTISGYNTPSGVLAITPIDEFVASSPVAGEQATKPYHLVRYDQLVDALTNVNPLDWQESVLGFSTASGIGARYVVADSGTSGEFVGHENEVAEWNGTIWVFQPPNEGFTLRDESRDNFWTFDGSTWGLFAATVDHSALDGLDGDDHERYVLADGTRGFTNTVSGVSPVNDGDLATKKYVDDADQDLQDQIDGLDTTLSGNYVTLDTAQTITGDKTFDNGLTTFLGDVFFDGIQITMSGTTLNTESGATFNYDSTSITNNAGATNYSSTSTITNSGTTTYGDTATVEYQSGSEITHESGSSETHESGSTDTYEDGSTLTLSGTNVDVAGDTTINLGDGTIITHESGSSEVYEGGSTTTHEDGSVDTYEDGSVLTFSGAEVTYSGDTNITVQSGTTTTYEDGSTTINEGDTVYGDTSTTVFEDGSEVTFSGATTFETVTYFNDDIVMASGTTLTIGDIVITGTISGSFTDTNRRYGQEPVINGSTSQAVLFVDDFPDDSYTLVATLTNEVDSPPSIYSTIQGVKTATGFTTYFSGVIDSSNFVLEWIAFLGQQE